MKRLPLMALVPLFIFLILSASLSLALRYSGDTQKFATHLNEAVPATNLPDIDQAAAFNTADWQARVYVINFFASWCIECHAEHEQLMQLAQKYKIPIIGIALKDKAEALQHFLSVSGNPYVLIADDTIGHTAIDWGLTGVPETFLVDGKGVIRFHAVGPMTDKIAETELLPLWKELNP